MKQFVATLDNQSKVSTLNTSLLVSMPCALPVLTFQLSPQERIEEIERELLALHSQVRSREQAALKPPATPKPFVSAPLSIPVPMPAPKGRRTPVLTPEFDDTPQVVFVSCPTTLTSKAVHGSVFHSNRRTTATTDVAVFALTPSAPISVSELMPECTATAEDPAATSCSISIPTIPNCAFAGAEPLLATAHADRIHSEPVYTSDHPTCSVSGPVIPSRTFAGAANSLTAAHSDGIISAIGPTHTFATAAAPSPVTVPTTVDRKSAPTSPLLVTITHLALASAHTTAPIRSTLDSETIPAAVSTPLSIPATISASEPTVFFDFPVTPTVSISEPAVIFDSVASNVFAPDPLLTCSPMATRLPIMTPSPNTTNVAAKISALTYVPQWTPTSPVMH